MWCARIDRQIGLEATPEEWLGAMVGVFREVRRVLRVDGSCWVNIGDSYDSGTSSGRKPTQTALHGYWQSDEISRRVTSAATKPKDLLLLPARLAIALQQDGWWVRSDIIWAKPNPMPESVTDRCTRSHEHIFMLTKNARYYFDALAIAEPLMRPEEADRATPARFGGADKFAEASKQSRLHSGNEYRGTPTGTRNPRDVWTIATEAFPGAHFATMPTALVERCIRAGTSQAGCCAQCSAPWVRTTERQDTGRTQKMADGWDTGDGAHGTVHRNGREAGAAGVPIMANVTTGWAPTCGCEDVSSQLVEMGNVGLGDLDGRSCGGSPSVKPCVVLDPFSGAGTTLLVADRLQRDAIGIELSAAYSVMATGRITGDAPLLVELAAD